MLRYLGGFLLWNLSVSVALILLPPAWGLAAALALGAFFFWGYLLRGPRPRRQWLALRLRPLRGAALRWTLWAVPTLLAFNWAFAEVYVRLVPVPPENFDPFAELMDEPLGRLAITVLAVAIAPVLEEFVFRGIVQSALQRRRGTLIGIGGAALLFALIHLLPWVFPLHLFLGLAFGYAVHATGSIWAGVILHSANNAAAILGVGLNPGQEERMPTLWETGPTPEWWGSVAALLVSGVVVARVARGLREGGLARRLRPSSEQE